MKTDDTFLLPPCDVLQVGHTHVYNARSRGQTVSLCTHCIRSSNKVTLCADLAPRPGNFFLSPRRLKSIPQGAFECSIYSLNALT